LLSLQSSVPALHRQLTTDGYQEVKPDMPRTKGPRADKVETVAEMLEALDRSSAAILTDYRGLTVAEITTLRVRLRATGGEYHVVKNTLFRRAMGERLTPELQRLLTGPTAIALATGDTVATAKALLDYLRELRRPDIAIKGGYVEGRVLTPDQVTSISKLPPRDVIRAQAVGTLQAPLNNFAGTLNGILSEFARTLQALSEKRQAAGA
jgi:large subunit ribosomal protein L10